VLVHGARARIVFGGMRRSVRSALDALRAWGLRVRARTGHNKAAVAVANSWPASCGRVGHRQREFEYRPPRAVAASV